jgi:hypothetical protein
MELKTSIGGYYSFLRNVFRYYAAYSGVDLFSIQLNAYTTMCEVCHIEDDICNQSELDTKFIAANVEINKMEANPDRSLTRFEFLEVICRIAISKYYKHGDATSESEAADMLIERHLEPYANVEDPSSFRHNILYCKEVDEVFKDHLPFIKMLYDKYSHSLKPGQKPIMTFSDYEKFVAHYEFLDHGYTERAVHFAFCFSQEIEHDEMDTIKHTTLNFPEFIECIGRLAKEGHSILREGGHFDEPFVDILHAFLQELSDVTDQENYTNKHFAADKKSGRLLHQKSFFNGMGKMGKLTTTDVPYEHEQKQKTVTIIQE